MHNSCVKALHYAGSHWEGQEMKSRILVKGFIGHI